MIWTVIFAIGAILLCGLSILAGAEWEPQVKAARRRVTAWFRAVPLAREHTGHHRPGAPLVVPLPAAQVIAHADAMHAASEPFLPSPDDDDGPVYRTLASYMQAGKPVEVPETPDKPPWMITTAAMEAVPDQRPAERHASEDDRRWYQMSHQGMSDDDIRADMRRVYAGRHALTAAPFAAEAEAGAQMARQP